MKKYSSAQKIAFIFGLVTASLIFINIINLYLVENHKISINSRFVSLFDLNKEKNVPALFSTLGLFISSILLVVTALKEKKLKKYSWLFLSFIFLLLTYDELFSFHESLIRPVRNYLNVTGYLYFAWVVPYGIVTLLLAFFFYKFISSLPASTKWLMVISGFIYVSGALGFELLGGKQYVSDGEIQTLSFRILYTIEESLEMAGIVLFLYSITDYLTKLAKAKTLSTEDIGQELNSFEESENDYRKTGTLS